jgi:hypothetical protein
MSRGAIESNRLSKGNVMSIDFSKEENSLTDNPLKPSALFAVSIQNGKIRTKCFYSNEIERAAILQNVRDQLEYEREMSLERKKRGESLFEAENYGDFISSINA